jgi:hypothetical protein
VRRFFCVWGEGRLDQGCQIFLWYIIPKPEKITKRTQNIPNSHKISQMSVKYSKWPLDILTFSNQIPSKIYPNWYFWFEIKPSGNPGLYSDFFRELSRHMLHKWVGPSGSRVLNAQKTLFKLNAQEIPTRMRVAVRKSDLKCAEKRRKMCGKRFPFKVNKP